MGRPRVPDIEIRVSQEYDGRWIGSIEKHGDMNVSGMDVYARTPSEAASEAVLLMMCVRRDRIRHGEEGTDAEPKPAGCDRCYGQGFLTFDTVRGWNNPCPDCTQDGGD